MRRSPLLLVLLMVASCAVFQTATGNGAGTEGGRLGMVRGLDGENHCPMLSTEIDKRSACLHLQPETAARADAEAGQAFPAPPAACGVDGLDAILATIRERESGGDYRALARGENPDDAASGAYQFIRGTWGNFGGYRHARDAPPEVQDDKARRNVAHILRNGPVETVPLVWYLGHVPQGAAMDVVPFPGAGNTLTPRQYQTRWMGSYARHAAACA